jgi:retinol dehydrogenase 14
MLGPNSQGQTTVAVVTGASQGIGKAAALDLARSGATVVAIARNRERGEAAVADIKAQSGNEHVNLLLADLSSQQEIRRLADELLKRYPRIDVLINNAGAVNMRRGVTVDGIEMTFAVNHLAPFLLTNLLLDRLKASTPARIVTVSSDASTAGKIDFEDLGGERGYKGWRAYSQSKLANILFSNELARRLDGSGVTANAVHPGTVSTGFGKNNRGWLRWGITLAGPFMLKPEQGAQTVVYVASSPTLEGVTGKYFAKSKEAAPPPAARDEAVARKLWDVSAQMTGVA